MDEKTEHTFEIIVDGEKLKYPMLRLIASWVVVMVGGYLMGMLHCLS